MPVWNSGQQHKEAARIRVRQAFEDSGLLFSSLLGFSVAYCGVF